MPDTRVGTKTINFCVVQYTQHKNIDRLHKSYLLLFSIWQNESKSEYFTYFPIRSLKFRTVSVLRYCRDFVEEFIDFPTKCATLFLPYLFVLNDNPLFQIRWKKKSYRFAWNSNRGTCRFSRRFESSCCVKISDIRIPEDLRMTR